MPRPVWNGSIGFGLVNVPVKLFAATESHRVAFHELEAKTGERIRYRRVAEGSGHEVAWGNVQKGFEVQALKATLAQGHAPKVGARTRTPVKPARPRANAKAARRAGAHP